MDYRRPEPWLVKLIPGADKLVREAEKARADLEKARTEVGRLAAIASPLIDSPGRLIDEHHNPRPGVPRADMQAAVDAWREARYAADERTPGGVHSIYERALDAVAVHVYRALGVASVVDAVRQASDASQERAKAALAELREALLHRRTIDGMLGLWRGEFPYFGLSYTLDEIEKHVNAIPLNGFNLAVALLEAMDLPPDTTEDGRRKLREIKDSPGAGTHVDRDGNIDEGLTLATKDARYREVLAALRDGAAK